MTQSVSIVTPTYNRAHLLPRTWSSLCKQTEQNFQWIVVDDGSTDNTREVIASFADPRIHYIWQDNAGCNSARNRGDREVIADYVIYLDSDDELYDADTLAMMLGEIRKTRSEIAAVAFTVVDSEGKPNYYKLDAERLEATYIDHVCESKFQGEFFSISRRNVIELAAWPPYAGLEVLRHWRIAKHHPTLFINRPARIYHKHSGDNLTGVHWAIKRASSMADASKQLIQEHSEAWRAHCPSQIGKYRFYRAMYLALSTAGYHALPDLLQALRFGISKIKIKAILLLLALCLPLRLRQWLFIRKPTK